MNIVYSSLRRYKKKPHRQNIRVEHTKRLGNLFGSKGLLCEHSPFLLPALMTSHFLNPHTHRRTVINNVKAALGLIVDRERETHFIFKNISNTNNDYDMNDSDGNLEQRVDQ